MTPALWIAIGVAIGMVISFIIGTAYEFWWGRLEKPKPQRTAYLVARIRQIPEYPYFAIKQIGTFSSPCPIMKLSLIPVTVFETNGDDYGQARKYLAMEMEAWGIPAKVIEEVT